MSTLLDVKNLSTHFNTSAGTIKAVNDVSFKLREGETLGLVGESGCGKSVTALSIMRLVPSPPGRIVSGDVIFQDQNLLKISEEEMQNVRGRDIGMIFQEPMTSLNPVLSIGRQLREPLELHLGMTKQQSLSRSSELLELVGIPDPATRLKTFPHQTSGGQRQRIMIAMALSCEPKLLIADEATTALDVTIQAQILEIIKELTDRLGTSVIIITHNLGVVARYADSVNVMYAGKLRESGSLDQVYKQPKHPYTVGLLNSVPTLDLDADIRLQPIRGEIPNLTDLPKGCAFIDRCDYAEQKCQESEPELEEVEDAHFGACWEHQRVNKNLLGITP
ncbi:MAG: ABC transporter ATP-binding protein [Chloroflexota bacterium]|nr:ABC transporter ATP-binding protein [Chloroflexota bacterium]MQG38161.1 ABC transporter ATP-binding protein [SAR202 cluster bacterium]|tara:strand:+ start:68 stop:1069 length:1002 start_codon:yes stop_codon:yes gene_type:complete